MPALRKRSTFAVTGLSLAIACALPGVATAANYTASTQAQLIAAINAANADGDPSSTITLSGNITLSNGTTLPSPTKPLTIDTQSFTLSSPGQNSNTNIVFAGTGATMTIDGTLAGGNGVAATGKTNAGGALQLNTAPSSVINNGHITGGTGAFFNGISGTPGSGVAMGAGTFVNNGTITGGGGATGLSGGFGVNLSAGGTFTNLGSVTGGTSQTGTGGAGMQIIGVGSTLNNSGTITGGQSLGGTAPGGAGVLTSGASSVVINNTGTIKGGTGALAIGANNLSTTIINSGTIQAGTGQANAIQETGINTHFTLTLELLSGSSISGNVVAGTSTTDTLILGGSTNATFDVSSIGPTAQYQNFEIYQKTGTSTWSLTGTGTASTPWNIQQGTLQIGNGGTSGSFIGNVTDNGTLAFDRSDVSTFANLISGSGNVSQVGTGTTILTAANTYTGGTTISAGTLQLGNGGTTGSIVGDVTDNGTLAFDHSDDETFAGTISGSGGVTQLSAGTTALTANNTYTGTTVITAGTLQLGSGGTTGSIVGNVTDNGSLVFNRSDDVSFGGVISGSGALTKLGTDTLTLTGNNTYIGITTISGGTLQVGNGGTSGSIAGDVVNNGTLIFDRSDAATFAGAISGSGGVNQMGSGSTTLTGNSNYTGATNISAGELLVNGSIANSAVTVASGAMLGGNGTVGATTVQAGGTIAPTGLGTLTVNGNYTQAHGATYQVNLNPASNASGHMAVNGTATLDSGATITVTKTPDVPYVIGNKYTVLTASGGVNGSFDLSGQIAISALLALTGSYDANNAYLTVQQTGSLSTVGTTPNQVATGGGVESTGPTSPTTTAVLNTATDNAARVALDQLSGEVFASSQTALQEDSQYSRDAATDRVREAFCSGGAATVTQNGTRTQDSDCMGNADRLVSWGKLFGSWGYNNGNGDAAKLDHSTGGLFLGADTPVSNWRVGALAGYGRSGFDVNTRQSSGSSDDYYFGVYGGTQWGALGFRTGASYTWHDLSSNRILDVPGLPGAVGANYHAGTTQVFGDLGYRIDAGTASYEPFANLAYARLHTGSFTENGVGGLTSQGEDMNTTFTTLGVRASNSFIVDGAQAEVHGSIGWRHSFGDVTPVSTVAFAGGSDFDISGVAIARNTGLVDLGLDVRMARNATLGIAYFGEYGSGAVDQGVRGEFHLMF